MSQGVRESGSQGVRESGSQGVKESRCQSVKESRSQSQSVSKIILEISKVYPIIIDSVIVDRRKNYDNDDRQTNPQTDRQTQ